MLHAWLIPLAWAVGVTSTVLVPSLLMSWIIPRPEGAEDE